MSEEGRVANAEVICKFLAKQITTGSKKNSVNEIELAERIGDIELRTQVTEASYIKVTVIDPEGALQTAGFVTPDEEGFLPEVEVEFPEGSGWKWMLCEVEGSTDVTSPNFTMVFEDKIVADLRRYWGPKPVPPGTQTRAQFVRSLINEVGQHGEAKIKFVCPSLNLKQPVEKKEEGGVVQAKTAVAAQQEEEKQNKTRGVGAGAQLTVKGTAITAVQTASANTLLSVGSELNAPQVAVEACMFAGVAESGLDPSDNNGAFWGVLAAAVGTIPQNNTAEMAHYFYSGGKGYQSGGAIALAKEGIKDPVEIAVRVEAPSVWPDNAYASESGYSSFLPEAKAIIQSGGGVKLGGEAGTSEGESDIAQLQRGTQDNPDEDSYECIQRLAQQVNWSAFTNGQNFFYMDGPDFDRQKPTLYIEIWKNRVVHGHSGASEEGTILSGASWTVSNTTFEYNKTRKIKGKVQRRARAIKPSTPAEVRFEVICGPEDFRAGETFVVQNSGTPNGRWVVADTTRNCLKDTFTSIVLAPTSEPLPEPQSSESGTISAEEAANLGSTASGVPKGIPQAASGQYRSPPTQGPVGTETPSASWNPQNKVVAKWIVPELEYAAAHGWSGAITSGFRPGSDPNTVTGVSEHSGEQYPHGAIDFGGPTEYTNREAFFAATKGYTGLTLIPAQFTNYEGNPSDGGHASGTGH